MFHSPSQNSSGQLGDVGDGGRLRCLHGKVDIFCVCVHVVLSPPGVRGLWPWCYGCHFEGYWEPGLRLINWRQTIEIWEVELLTSLLANTIEIWEVKLLTS